MTERRSTATTEVVIRSEHGLHLRPATQFARIVLATRCSVRVEANGAEASGSSVLELALLAVRQGATIRITAEGDGADDVLRALVTFISGDPTET